MKNYIVSFIFGLLAGLSFPPFYLFIFLPISFYYLLDKINNSTSYKKSFLFGITFGFGYYIIQLYWISFSLFVDFKTYFWLIPFAISIIPLICGLFIGGTTLLLHYFIKKFDVKNKFYITIIFSFLYVFFEYIRSFIFSWNLFSYTMGFSNIMMQIVSVINIYLYDIILIFLSCFSYVLFLYKNKKIKINENYKRYIYVYIFIFICIFLYGIIRLNNVTIKKFNLNIKLVQANIEQNLKWNKNEIKNNLYKHIELSQDDYSDLIIWAESSIPYITNKNSILGNLTNKILISGAIRGEFKDGELSKIWNSIFIFKNGKVVNYYDKQLLVPFGEYIPFSKYIPFIKKITNGTMDFSKGTSNNYITINNIKLNPIICYEITFPNFVSKKNKNSDIILNLTNDGWFGISSGPYQHFVAAKFRAVENKTPVIRVSNSGISAYIDKYGRVVKKLNLNTRGFLDLEI